MTEQQADEVIRNAALWHPLRRISQSPERPVDWNLHSAERRTRDAYPRYIGAGNSNIAQWHPLRRVSQSPDRTVHIAMANRQETELEAYAAHTGIETSLKRARPDQQPFLNALWRREVSIRVETRASRDHLANERTFLAWLRTSIALSMIGILTTQLFTLQATRLPDMNLSFFVLGVPLGSVCQAAALFNIIIGAHRFWRHQKTIVTGRACAGGWEILLIGGLVTIVSAARVSTTERIAKIQGRSSWCS
jgi:uncharacterized membrane protein YidH (DUF202 family)